MDVRTSQPCPRCCGKLEFKDTVESPTTGSLVRFFQSEDCGYVHTVKRRTPALEAAAKRKRA